MNTDENLHCEKAENKEMIEQNSELGPGVKSKNKTSKSLKDPTKTINDYFPVVRKSNVERGEDSGGASKDESRATEYTTPDKSIIENANCQANGLVKGK